MADGIHHVHTRKRIHELRQPYPHPDRWISHIDSLVFIVALFGVIMTIPQVLDIWGSKSAVNVSLVSWAAYGVAAFFWIIYGLVHKDKVIIAVYSLYALLDALVVIGVLLYG